MNHKRKTLLLYSGLVLACGLFAVLPFAVAAAPGRGIIYWMISIESLTPILLIALALLAQFVHQTH